MPAFMGISSARLIAYRIGNARQSNRDPHLRRLRSSADRQRRGLRDYRRFSTAYRSALEKSRTRVPKDPGVVS